MYMSGMRISAPILWFALSCVMAFQCMALPEPSVEWSVDLGSSMSASPIAYPSEKPNSVVLGIGGRAVRINGDGNIIFDRTFGPDRLRGDVFDPSAADLDGDGREELVVGHNAGFIYAMNAENGEILWERNIGTELSSWRMATPADLNGDGRAEVIASNMDGWIYCLSPDGNVVWRSKIEEYRLTTPAVGDINNDGDPEIVYGSSTRHMVALDADGHVLWDSFQPALHLGRTAPIIADLDRDGDAEIYGMSSMIAFDTGLVSLNGKDGSLRWVGATHHKAYRGRNVVRFNDGTYGILACDKGNNVCAYQADGQLRWRTRISGHGIWTAPVVADLDGDGICEIVVTVRGVSRDGLGISWYVLNVSGEILGAYESEGGGFGGALVEDIDGDGILEVVIVSQSGKATSYTFGGPASPDAIVSSSWRGPAYPLRNRVESGTPKETPPETELLQSLPKARFGNNPVILRIPQAAGRLGVEFTTIAPDGVRQIQVFHAQDRANEIAALWPVYMRGRYEVGLRLLDLDNGKVLGTQSVCATVRDVARLVSEESASSVRELRRIGDAVAEKTPEAEIILARREADVGARFQIVKAQIDKVSELDSAARDALAQRTDEFLAYLTETQHYAALLLSETQAGRNPLFVMWQDKDPWDNDEPRNDIPEHGGPLEISAWAFGNETESIVVNALNLSPQGLTLRVEPGTFTREGESKSLRPAHEVTSLHRAVWLPSRFGEIVPDVLPLLGDGYLLDIAPGEVQQLWINIRTHGIEPGTYDLKWPVRTLDSSSFTQDLSIRFEVSTVSLPEKSRFLLNCWSRNRIGNFSTVSDLSEHLQTVWYGLPLPGAKADAEGELIGDLDWSAHDAIIAEAKQVELILYGGVPTPSFPKGVEVTDELRLKARRNYVKAWVAHLRTLGLDYKNFMLYPEDEPGLTGDIDGYMQRARENKEIDPNLQNYANPWGGITIEMIREMAPITDVWQPGMENIEFLGQSFVDAMREGDEPIMTYTPPGNARILRPLGFYRSQPWLAFHWGIIGGGWWVYQGADLWPTDPDGEPSYGAVNYDGRALVTSRRWEASRDGIEDFNILCLLRDQAEAKNDAEAKKCLEDAVAYVAGRAITGMPREAADYDLDYPTLMEHRSRIRKALERLQE
ncbi:MAG: FG-GAP-like repeat-containing protein [bacterium]